MKATNTAMAKANRKERGAALVTVLMISTLMLATGGTLVLVTSLAARTTYDATAERQAYYSAEAGMQEALNVLRGNVAPQPGMPAGSQINFRGAVTLANSNRPGDVSDKARLSGWLNYSADRVALTANYTPISGLAYDVEVIDPDSTPVPSGEPTRLLLRVRGYGPKGAEKRLELIVQRTNFDYAPPAMLLMRGAGNCNAMTFSIGSSNAKEYSGHDRASTSIVPTFGATCDGDEAIELASDSKETVAEPKADKFDNPELPAWLRTADEARAFLAEQKLNAQSQGRYFTSFDGTSGTSSNKAFTFVDGDCDLDGGGGLLIVTGTLRLHGNPSFDGLILVLGNGRVERDGGGNGDIYGAVTVAKFNATGDFLPPFFDTNGGGNSLMKYDSASVRAALNVAGPRILGIHEY